MHNTKFWQENLKKREHLKDQSRWEDVEWIHLAQDRDQWRAFLNH